jgi:hypothetical protein
MEKASSKKRAFLARWFILLDWMGLMGLADFTNSKENLALK